MTPPALESLKRRVAGWPIETQLAQCLMLGYTGDAPSATLRRFLALGLGGVIFFRDNFQSAQTAIDVQRRVLDIRAQVPGHLPAPFLAIDQEGGQVERLPFWTFPSTVTPRAIAQSRTPLLLARRAYQTTAAHLAALGFNLNFFPTLDVNLDPKNPIIGVRSFGDTAQTVWPLARAAIDAFRDSGVLAVGKHFPGHGNGTVDSHLALPHLVFTQEECGVFDAAIRAGIPALLVSHGFYPNLQPASEWELPASASPTIIGDLLRKQLGFTGLLISDDMSMGAAINSSDPAAAALRTLLAGVDLLVYRDSTETEQRVFEGLQAAIEDGRLSRTRVTEAACRVLAAKSALTAGDWREDRLWDTATANQQSAAIAEAAITLTTKAPAFHFPIDPDKPWLLVHPERGDIVNYRFDQAASPELDACFARAGFSQLTSLTYPVGPSGAPVSAGWRPETLPWPDGMPAGIVLVTFNPRVQPHQVALYQWIKRRYPNTHLVLVSAGMPDCPAVMPNVSAHVALCSYRPASMRALPAWLLAQR